MNTPSALIVDDELQIRKMLRYALEGAGWKVFEATGGKEALTEAACRLPDIVLLDLGLPDLSGMTVLAGIREWSTVPVIVLTARDEEEDKVAALDAGADDYVTKPFSPVELMARMRAAMRRGPAEGEPLIELGRLRIDRAAHTAHVSNYVLDLTPTEFKLLRVLASNAGKIVTHSLLLTSVWGPNATGQSQYLRVFMSHIRRKLCNAGLPPGVITTEAGVGYRLLPEVAE